VKALKMAVVFGECGRECLSGPGNTEYLPAVPVRQQAGGGAERALVSDSVFSTLYSLRHKTIWRIGVVSECC
jgi:hypothetical protein